jgi:dynein heavy chain
LSSDAANSIPIGLLNRCIKITNEPPAGLKANIKRAFASLNKETFEECDSKMKSILFGLCHFHAVMLERKQYGPMGFNMMYPVGPMPYLLTLSFNISSHHNDSFPFLVLDR